jgi:nicotinamidase-related amidase
MSYDPDTTAILLVDPYNDFLSEGGKLWPRIRAIAEKVDLLEHLRQVVSTARARGIKVIFVPHHRWQPGDYENFDNATPYQLGSAKAQVFAKDTWGGTFHDDFQPQASEIVALEHWGSSGFANTDLDLQLSQRGIRRIILIGMIANTCIESAGRFGMELGYQSPSSPTPPAPSARKRCTPHTPSTGRPSPTRSSPPTSCSPTCRPERESPRSPRNSRLQENLMALPVLAQTSLDVIINAPVESIDLTDWVFGITDAEYQACSVNHIAAAATRTADGRRMSINVERVGPLIVQHYVEDIAKRTHCRLVSVSDAFGPGLDERGQLGVRWEFSVEAIDETTTRFANYIQVSAGADYDEALRQQGATLEQAQQRTAAALVPHNAEETPLFAQDIERKARAGRWQQS